MSSTIFILTDEFDSHADAVILELNKRNIPVFRFHPDDYPRRYRISIETRSGSIQGEIADEYRVVSFKDITSAWFRGSRTSLPRKIAPTDTRLEDYINLQAREMINTVIETLDTVWISDPRRLRRANVKAIQLAEASRVGLNTPYTLISNDPSKATLFVEHLQDDLCAIKPLTIHGVTSDDGYRFPLTTVLPKKHPLDSVTSAPNIFQPYIDKVADLRCVFMDGHIFCAKILSQEHEETKQDWRGADCRYEVFSLPEAAQSSISLMMKSFGLNLASMDMVLTRSGDIVFLELNPVGQWLWLEDELGFPLVATIVRMLTRSLS